MTDVTSVVPEESVEQATPEAVGPVALTDELIGFARDAAVDEAGGAAGVGDYLGARSEDAVAISASFAATDRGYRGWYWLVTLAVVESTHPTISEVVLLPGDGALLAPAWVPWDQRVRPGDLGVGDLLPPPADDPRLVPGYLDSDDPAVREVDYEFGFGRVRVLGREGRDDAATRWHDGSFGPSDPMAQQAPGVCATCGFYVRLEGLLGQIFGACANEFSPADGRVVDAGYGCGAHSETVVNAPLISASTVAVMDEVTLEVHRRPAVAAAGDAVADETETGGAAEPVDGAVGTDGATMQALEIVDAAGTLEFVGGAETGIEPVGGGETGTEPVGGAETGTEPVDAGEPAEPPEVVDSPEIVELVEAVKQGEQPADATADAAPGGAIVDPGPAGGTPVDPQPFDQQPVDPQAAGMWPGDRALADASPADALPDPLS